MSLRRFCIGAGEILKQLWTCVYPHRPSSRSITFLALASAVVLFSRQWWPPTQISVNFGGHTFSFRTYQGRGNVLPPEPPDRLLSIQPAASVKLMADGVDIQFPTNAATIEQVLSEAEVSLSPYDLVLKDGWPASLQDGLRPSPITSRGHLSSRGAPPPQRPITLEVKRAVPIFLHDNGLVTTLYTTQGTIEQILAAAGVHLGPDDLVSPSLEAGATPGSHIYIKRSMKVNVEVDNDFISVATVLGTVDQLLHERGIILGPMDRVEPGLNTPIKNGLTVRVVRVSEEVVIEETAVGHSTRQVPDPNLEIGRTAVLQEGRDGVLKRTVRVRYENGQEVSRIVEGEVVDPMPQDTIISYGTKIVIYQLDTPYGTINYWRTLRVFATSYDASQGGKPKGSPGYGITATGLKAGYGVIAVDPTVIPLFTRIYVPGYGIGIAGDTGGAVKGLIIDLGFPEGQTNSWSAHWVDIYLLEPAPSSG